MSKAESLYQKVGGRIEGAVQGQMFGKPCLKINGKAFACFFQEAMVFKLPDEVREEALGLDGAQLFDPSGKGRAMKEWVQVPHQFSRRWTRFAQAAADYVGIA